MLKIILLVLSMKFLQHQYCCFFPLQDSSSFLKNISFKSENNEIVTDFQFMGLFFCLLLENYRQFELLINSTLDTKLNELIRLFEGLILSVKKNVTALISDTVAIVISIYRDISLKQFCMFSNVFIQKFPTLYFVTSFYSSILSYPMRC